MSKGTSLKVSTYKIAKKGQPDVLVSPADGGIVVGFGKRYITIIGTADELDKWLELCKHKVSLLRDEEVQPRRGLRAVKR